MNHCVIRLLPILLLAACAGGATQQQSVTDRATYDACRNQANLAYNLQNRDKVYRIYDTSSPQSGIGLTQSPTQSLSDSYAQQRLVQDCIRNTGTETSRVSGSSPAGTGPAPPGTGKPGGAQAPGGTATP
ncbi:MAG: hypothetical protein ACREF3_00540 [Acetobacteraceae bacterium]